MQPHSGQSPECKRMCHLVGEMDGTREDLEVALGSELDALTALPCERQNVVAFATGAPSLEAQCAKLCALPCSIASCRLAHCPASLARFMHAPALMCSASPPIPSRAD